ncbi:MAG: SPOR domain-containing protein [Bacteroidales bacterium]|nr:SPOR domain-containing protein [Bacteroidales bacterium]
MRVSVRFVRGIVLAAFIVASFSGCDSFRRLAGRPTSADIQAKREMIAAEQAAHQARVDSLKRVEKAKADSLELLDRIRESGEMFLSATSLRRADVTGLEKRYYIIVGAFSSSDNAVYMAKKIEAAGYDSVRIPYGNGFTAVGTGASDTLAHLWDKLHRVRNESFCPKDVWILVNE